MRSGGDKTNKQWSMYVKRTHSSEIQAFRGKIGGLANTSEQQAIKGKKSGAIRFEGSNEQLKPWEPLGISRRTYYRRIKEQKLSIMTLEQA